MQGWVLNWKLNMLCDLIKLIWGCKTCKRNEFNLKWWIKMQLSEIKLGAMDAWRWCWCLMMTKELLNLQFDYGFGAQKTWSIGREMSSIYRQIGEMDGWDWITSMRARIESYQFMGRIQSNLKLTNVTLRWLERMLSKHLMLIKHLGINSRSDIIG